MVELYHQPDTADPAGDLTPREREILELLVGGYRYKEIGTRLTNSLDEARIRRVSPQRSFRSPRASTAIFLISGSGSFTARRR